MNDYLIIPSYYSNIQKNIYSKDLLQALREDDILSYLRHIYKTNISLFYNIRDELILRGIIFKEKYQNNIFPSLQYEIKHIIGKDNPGKSYLNIDNNVTGILAFINRYKIESDSFFVNVPLEGLAYALNKDTTLLAIQLERAGFFVKPVNEYTAKNLSFMEMGKTVITKNDEDGEFKEVSLNKSVINEWFDSREFLAFTRYCKVHGKMFISELTLDFVKLFQHVKGIGRKRYLRVLERFNELTEKREISLNRTKESKKIIKMTALEYFVNNPLKRAFDCKQIDYLEFLNSIYITEEGEIYSEIQSNVLDEKINFVKEIVDEIKTERKERAFLELKEAIINDPNYPLFMEMTKGNIQRLFHIVAEEGEEKNIRLFEMIEDNQNENELILISNGLNKFITINEKINNIKEDIDARVWKILMERVDKTLQEVGEIFGVTRERVRQIERKALGQLKLKNRFLQLDIYFNHFLQNDISMTLETFMEKLQIDPSFNQVFTICISQNEQLELKNGLIFNKDLSKYVLKQQGVISSWDKTLVDATEALAQFNCEGEFVFTVQTIDKFMEEIGFMRRNSLYFKRTIKMPDQISYLFKYKIQGPLEMTDEAFDYVQELMDEVFGEQFESGKRAAVARMRDTKNVILVEANTYMYFDLSSVQQELLDEIETSIEEALEMDEMVTANTLFLRSINTWKSYNINTHFHLYSILQYHFAGVYVIGKGNTLGIYRSNQAKVDIENILIAQLENDGGVRSKKDILDYFKWPSYKLDQLIARSRELIIVEEEGLDGYGVRLFSSLKFTEVELKKIRKFIENFMQETYLYPMDLFIEMEFDDELSDILARRNITNLYTFVSLLKWLNSDLRGFPQFLYLKDTEVNTFERGITYTFDAIVRRDELEGFLDEKGYSVSGITKVINVILENNYFYTYTAFQFINAKQIDFNEDVKESLKSYLQKSFGDKSYISALDLTGYTTDIKPVSTHEWQPQLITTFVHEVGYRYIRTAPDYRYNKWIIVRDDLKVTNYEELVHHVITSEYKGRFHERDIAEFLVERKLAHNPNQLPVEIKTSKYFIMKDLGFVEVKERSYGVNRLATTI